MKKILSLLIIIAIIPSFLFAQKIIPIEYNGTKYEVLDMTATGRIQWGGYTQIPANAARSESDGASNTKAIITAVGNNDNYEGRPYPAKICSEATNGGKDDWYLPSKDETDAIYASKEKFEVEEKGSIWTSTEANGTQAFTKYWYTGAFYKNAKVQSHHFVCIRKVE